MRNTFPTAVERARRLRRDCTDVERKMWRLLHSRHFCGYKFRRQHPLGPYIVDFFCMQQRLVIELDGGQHDAQREADARRDEWLRSSGYRVLRFWNHDVTQNCDGVLTMILEALEGDARDNA